MAVERSLKNQDGSHLACKHDDFVYVLKLIVQISKVSKKNRILCPRLRKLNSKTYLQVLIFINWLTIILTNIFFSLQFATFWFVGRASRERDSLVINSNFIMAELTDPEKDIKKTFREILVSVALTSLYGVMIAIMLKYLITKLSK